MVGDSSRESDAIALYEDRIKRLVEADLLYRKNREENGTLDSIIEQAVQERIGGIGREIQLGLEAVFAASAARARDVQQTTHVEDENGSWVRFEPSEQFVTDPYTEGAIEISYKACEFFLTRRVHGRSADFWTLSLQHRVPEQKNRISRFWNGIKRNVLPSTDEPVPTYQLKIGTTSIAGVPTTYHGPAAMQQAIARFAEKMGWHAVEHPKERNDHKNPFFTHLLNPLRTLPALVERIYDEASNREQERATRAQEYWNEQPTDQRL